ncbi:LapA family protein [Desulfurispirillum indicum]|uniref:Lipopolysaccharide assembly protein A domain-containing protein n=1 Tax=Desulfurispirillum indicum (strain ATCC BAA-1389 / DSM 22839 / S5) TaxID=653733 RepID=E6W5I0_DESIS|nr:LapA family protein [Desulfurispirillum indicum]ADU64911.1 hypothetical protein Selin_0153 [Desulfurispirillum indicum S5]UCZ56842.1 LapA family protein [Desulfurispirillum indicum]
MDGKFDLRKLDVKTLKRIGLGAAALLLVIVLFQNIHSVDTRLLFIKITMPHAVWAILFLGAGFIAGWLMGRARLRREEPQEFEDLEKEDD